MSHRPSAAPAMPPSARTTLRRKPQRGRYDAATIHAILDAALVCHVAFHEGGSVHSLPTVCWRVADHLYIHGARNGRLCAALLAGECAVSVALVDGLVLARSAFRHSMNFRSVVIYGQFAAVDDADTARAAYAALVDHVSPGRSLLVRAPSPAELAGTCLLRLPLAEAAAKVRSGGVEDNPDDLAWPAWAGVVPLTLQAGPLLPQPDCGPFPAPQPPAFLARRTA